MTPPEHDNACATAFFHTFGCKLNFAETSSVAEVFASRGIRSVGKDDNPDFVVINTCSVTAEADRKCRAYIRSLHRQLPEAAILVTGCYAQLQAQTVAGLPGVAAVAGINDKLALADIAMAVLEGKYSQPDIAPANTLRGFMPSCSRGDRTRFFLKVQDGCDYWCTYCTIPRARGRSRSGTIEELVALAEKAAAEGGKEIVITGVNIGDFGAGRSDRLIDLCRRLDKVEGIERYRISSIEPNLLTDELIEFTAGSRAFMPHFHVPLQSGSDAVLAMMRRRYDTAFFRSKIERIKELIPDAFIGVDLIVGARGETPGEFARSRDFVDSLPVSRLHVFPYSERPGTRALDLDGVVPENEKHRRVAEMTAVSDAHHAAFARSYIGKVRPVLLEHQHDGGPLAGFTDNYIRVHTDVPSDFDNRILPLRLQGVCPGNPTELIAAPLDVLS